jgi:hypothetical protein
VRSVALLDLLRREYELHGSDGVVDVMDGGRADDSAPRRVRKFIRGSLERSANRFGDRAVGRGRASCAAAANLGFDGTNVYYFDLESFNTGNSTCRTAVKSFINGWSSRIQSYWGEKANTD